MLTVDARGLNCPEPVIKTKKALDTIEKGVVETIVDNDVARQNVLKFAGSMKYETVVQEIGSSFSIKIVKHISIDAIDTDLDIELDDVIYFIDCNTLGRGNDQLGGALMKSFFYTILQRAKLPKNIVFMNSGVFLVCENSPVLDHLQELADSNVDIVACGTCLEYYSLKDKVQVGGISNMYEIVEILNSVAKVIKI